VGQSSVLIISSHPLFAEAIARILQREAIEVLPVVGSVEAALPLIEAHQPEAIIVDREGTSPIETDLVALLGEDRDRQVIFLTLNENQIVVHSWQRVQNATSDDLVSILRRHLAHAVDEGGRYG